MLAFAVALSGLAAAAADNVARQVWSSFGKDPLTSLTVSFASSSPCAAPALNFGTSPGALAPAADVAADAPFDFNNAGGLAFYYRARLTGLAPGTRYYYQVAACGAFGPVLSTSTLPAGADLTVLLTGDMGRDDGEQILPQLLLEAEAAVAGAKGAANMFVIAGDFAVRGNLLSLSLSLSLSKPRQALLTQIPSPRSSHMLSLYAQYDLHDKEGLRGANYMERLSNVSAFIPTVCTIGSEWVGGNAWAPIKHRAH